VTNGFLPGVMKMLQNSTAVIMQNSMNIPNPTEL
jgi:hypothetical protein